MAVNYAQQLGLGKFDPIGGMQEVQANRQNMAFNQQTMDIRGLNHQQQQDDRSAQQAQQQAQQVKAQEMQALSDQARGFVQSGDLDSLNQIMTTNPELREFWNESAQFMGDEAKQGRVKSAISILEGADPIQAYQQRRAEVAAKGGDTTGIDKLLEGNDPEQMLKTAKIDLMMLDPEKYSQFYGGNDSSKPAGQREREALLSTYNSSDPNSAEHKSSAIALGLKPRAVGSSMQTIAEEGNAEDIAQAGATIEGAKAEATETKKLQVQFKLSPEIAAAVITAKRAAITVADQADTQKSNTKAYSVYQAGIDGLATALSNADTGIISGTMLALSDNNKIASGAVAAMAPILKQMFRSAGEGNFTDSDQKLLMDMIPTTSDSPKVAQAKLRNIDLIVKAKLGINDKPANQAPPQQQKQVSKGIEDYTDEEIDNMNEAQLDQLAKDNGL